MLSEAMADFISAYVQELGDTFIVNGQPIQGVWQDAQLGQIHRFLRDEAPDNAAFSVILPNHVLAAPYSLRNGMNMFSELLPNWKLMVREIIPNSGSNHLASIEAKVSLIGDTVGYG